MASEYKVYEQIKNKDQAFTCHTSSNIQDYLHQGQWVDSGRKKSGGWDT